MTAVISAFLDNVTTILLMTPIVVRLCECLQLNPVPIFPIIILHANIAGLSTLIGHPPNLMITANPYVSKHGISFLTYSLHMIFGVILALVQTNVMIRLLYRNIYEKLATKKSPGRSDLLESLAIWENAGKMLPLDGLNEIQSMQRIILDKVLILKSQIETDSTEHMGNCIAPDMFGQTLARLKKAVNKFNRQSSELIIFIAFFYFFYSTRLKTDHF